MYKGANVCMQEFIIIFNPVSIAMYNLQGEVRQVQKIQKKIHNEMQRLHWCDRWLCIREVQKDVSLPVRQK